jgi:hypothetical protein
MTGDPMAAFEHIALAISNLHDSGNTTTVRSPLAILSATLDRLGRYEPAAIIAGFAASPFTLAAAPELSIAIDHLREALGGEPYELLTRTGEAMTTAEMVSYAYEQIDLARAEMSGP